MRNRVPTTDPAPPAIHEIRPNNVYSADEVRKIFRLKASTIRREVREGRLRIARRAGRYFLLGRWIIEWLEAGEVKRPRAERAGG
jgi:hypothetical protein